MKYPKKFLHAARKMEVRQIARKAPDIAESYGFTLQHERYRQHQFDSMLDDEKSLHEADQSAFEPFQEAEEERVGTRNDELLSGQTFEREAFESQQYAKDNAFDIIAEMQGFDFEGTRPYAVKHLPAASSDLFVNDVTNITEQHLEEELMNNKRAITPWKEKVRTALIRQEEPTSTQKHAPQQPISDKTVMPELSEEHIKEALKQEEDLKKTDPAKSVFYFRPPTKPKTS